MKMENLGLALSEDLRVETRRLLADWPLGTQNGEGFMKAMWILHYFVLRKLVSAMPIIVIKSAVSKRCGLSSEDLRLAAHWQGKSKPSLKG